MHFSAPAVVFGISVASVFGGATHAVQKAPAVSIEALPPVVVKTVPASGETDVDAAKTTQIRVTFSKKMTDRSWSWTELSPDSKLPVVGEPKFGPDGKTCVVTVKLEPGKIYATWLNSEKFHNFKDADGKPAVPYLLVFETKPK